MTKRKLRHRNKVAARQKEENARLSFADMCMTYRPLFDRCLSQEGQAVFDKTIPDAIMEHIQKLGKQGADPMMVMGSMGFALQTVLVGYAHLLNCVEDGNEGVKAKVLREFLNSIHQNVHGLEGLPAGQ